MLERLQQLIDAKDDARIATGRSASELGEYVALSAGITRYELSGPVDGPRVLLVHGLSGPLDIWNPTLPALTAAGYRVLRYDLYGRGFSDRPRVEYGPALYRQQLRELQEHVGWSGPMRCIGWSMGCLILADFLKFTPGLATHLCFFTPAGMPLDLPFTAKLAKAPIIGDVLMTTIGKQVLSNGDGFHRLEDAGRYLGLVKEQMGYGGFTRSILSSLRNMPLQDALDLYAELNEQGIPTLVIWGEHDSVIPASSTKNLLEAMPGIELQVLEESGHAVHFERAETVNPLLVQFFSD